ncbi:MAG: PTS sugar transporter subunit IIA [Proteobacteria bacterium]|jgi:PTS system nitrogen regulatory IIA component|nr:PTS sugar transporter subunit IIA [Pseudomonadota bacterium]
MNPLRDTLAAEDIELDAAFDSADAVLARLAAMLARRTGLPAGDVLRGLERREQLGSTALGHGVAIPHARIADCGTEAAALVRTATPVQFAAPDGRPVSLFLGLVVPAQAGEGHLRLLAAAAALLGDRAKRMALAGCASPAAVTGVLETLPDDPGGTPR